MDAALHDEVAATELAATMPASLRLLARGLLNRDLAIQHLGRTAQHELPLRPVLTTSHLLLPDEATPLAAPARHELHRAAVAHAVAHLLFSTSAVPAKGLKPMTVALVSALEDARVERLLLQDHPGMRDWFVSPLRNAVQPHGVTFAALLSRLDLALMDSAYLDDHHWVHKARSLFEQQAADLHDHDGFRRIAFVLATDLGQMRVAFRPQQHVVSGPHRDDNTYLWAHDVSEADPPPELELEVPPRPPDLAQALRQPEGQLPPALSEETVVSRHAYPEWHHRLSLLRQDWCTVVDKLPPWRHGSMNAQAAESPATSLALRRSRSLDGGRRLRRQSDGDELDLNAAIDFMVERRSQPAADARLFTRLAPSDKAASILVLLDLSESTNDRLGNPGPSFLDIEKQAALMLADAVTAAGDRIALHGFSSNTRDAVSYYRLLSSGQAVDATVRALVSSAPGRHSTRLGAALRHATASLADDPRERKAILVLTDGAPSDIDVHEPRYLVEDARHAALAARAAGVQVHGLVVDRQADVYARRIFGWRNHHLVEDALTLPARLCGWYRWFTAA